MRRVAVLFLALLGVTACRHVSSSTAPRPAPAAAVPAADYYSVPGPVQTPTRRHVEWRERDYTMERILLPPRVPPAMAHVPHVDDSIEIMHVRPRPAGRADRPLVFMFPILSNRMILMREFATGFIRQGYDVAIVPRKELAFDPVKSVERAEDELRVLIMRARQAVDWLVHQPGVDGTRLGICGISAGGILGAALLGSDPRFKAGVFILAGGPMADVMIDTTEGEFADNLPRVEAALGWDKETIRRRLRSIIRTDPIVLAPGVPRENVLLFIAERDDSVPTRYQWALWEALGRPEAHVLPTGHYTTFAFFMPFVLRQSQRFLGSRLGTP